MSFSDGEALGLCRQCSDQLTNQELSACHTMYALSRKWFYTTSKNYFVHFTANSIIQVIASPLSLSMGALDRKWKTGSRVRHVSDREREESAIAICGERVIPQWKGRFLPSMCVLSNNLFQCLKTCLSRASYESSREIFAKYLLLFKLSQTSDLSVRHNLSIHNTLIQKQIISTIFRGLSPNRRHRHMWALFSSTGRAQSLTFG